MYKIREGIQIKHSIGKERGSYLSDKVDDDRGDMQNNKNYIEKK